MGLESELRKEIRITHARKVALNIVGSVGYISLALLVPKVTAMVAQTHRSLGREDERARSVIGRLIAKGALERSADGVRLTAKGRRLLELSLPRASRPKKWDGYWRMVIFDIPERRAQYRNALRNYLREIGFFQLQASVWIFPFDCEDLIALLRTEYRLGKEVQYVVVQKIEHDLSLRRHFDLPQ